MLNSAQQQAFLTKAIDAVKDYAIFILSPEGIVLSWNQGAAQLKGYTAEEIIGQSFTRFYIPEEVALGHPQQLLQLAKEQGSVEDIGWRVRKDGSRFWADVTLTAIYDNNKLMGFTKVTRDLTERLLAQKNQVTLERYQQLIRASNTIIWTRDATGAFVAPQLDWEVFTGQPWEAHQEMGWLQAHHPEERERVRAIWQEKKTASHYFEYESRLWSAHTQTYHSVVVRVTPTKLEHGRVSEWTGIHIDVSPLKHTETQLRAALDRLNLTLQSARVGLWHWDIQANALTLDDNAMAYFDMSAESPTHTLEDLMAHVYEADREPVQQAIQRSIESGTLYQVEFRIRRHDGSINYVTSRGEVRYDKADKAVRMLGISWDISEQKQLEAERIKAQLAESQRQQQEKFTDTICHELRNPLNGILGSLETLKEAAEAINSLASKPTRNESDEEQIKGHAEAIEKTLHVVEECGEHQRNIINQVLELSHLDTGKVHLQRMAFSLNKTIKAVVAMHEVEAAKKRLNLLPPQLPEEDYVVESDGTRFKQILINLLANAINYTDQGTITLSLKVESHADNQATVTVKLHDTGKGFTDEEKAQLFDRFSQIQRSRHLQYDSSGLGLTITKQLVELLGGTIEVESRKWQGSTFTLQFTWPLAQLSQAMTPPNPETPRSPITPCIQKSINVLIVEDNAINQRVLRRFVEQEGYKIDIANDGVEAVDKYQTFKPQLIFMDIEMPRQNGFDATIAIRALEREKQRAAIPIYAVSGYVRQEYHDKAREVGMNGFISKPIKKEEILKVLAENSGTQAESTPRLSY